jgi:dihydrofolate reductase
MSTDATRITLIVARSRNGVIGRDNTLPWHLPEDLKHFKATTLGHTMIMGRKTFDSIGRPLPGRRTIVLSRDRGWTHPGCERADSLDAALRLASGATEIFVVGGEQVYRTALSRSQRAIVTEIDVEVTGDASFPDLPSSEWVERSREVHRSQSGLGFSIIHYERRPG